MNWLSPTPGGPRRGSMAVTGSPKLPEASKSIKRRVSLASDLGDLGGMPSRRHSIIEEEAGETSPYSASGKWKSLQDSLKFVDIFRSLKGLYYRVYCILAENKEICN
jgi:hypothetical protein